ncbi:L,D-transpeptidase family protein [Alicyclobacillus dauci]|uniref:Peptidoglycan-binding protein n=1 Tax=Alicyclobacillus dauci TaxID=1475485 RepID=A0ABY6Z162_9BACL|nr:peptidoglycan-binding protein [Alicyclobacillus dauci]WAH36096.1 peptidoglycan-binding protein [Alicyclobacillus dauci]
MRRQIMSFVAGTSMIAAVALIPQTASAATSTTVNNSVTQLQKELAALGYLPLTSDFQWRFAPPATLQALWQKGVNNVMTKGAVMEFQEVNHLSIDGIAGPQTWAALTKAYEANKMNPYGYTYVLVSEQAPETLRIWSNGKLVLSSLANTGIAQRPTTLGTFPVYERYWSQEMRGTNPNGSYYDDPGVPYVNYFYGGEAIHGFWRKTYGSPQSLGCVELPISNAKIAWNYIHYGTLVTVQKGGTSQQPSGPSSYVNYPTLHEGMFNNDVKILQKALGIAADGDFGPMTDAVVKNFQKQHGLTVDGIVGQMTWKALLA